jgi:rfaE bifunctional protein nucleotidyltransferase chain/domain
MRAQELSDRPALHDAHRARARDGGSGGAARLSARIVTDYRALAERLAPERKAGRTVALANGCFDVLHVGHVRLLAEAREHADLLVVALNADESARSLKGEGRPLVPLAERMEVVAALAGVDFVTSFPELTASALIDAIRPEVQIKGTDRSPDTVPERAQVERYGGRIVICGDPKTHSSTALAARLRRG